MPETIYTYDIAVDTLNGKANPSTLQTEILASSITVATSRIDTSGGTTSSGVVTGGTLSIVMKDAIVEATLAAVVGAHAGEPSTSTTPVEVEDVYDYVGHFYSVIEAYDNGESLTVIPNGEQWQVKRFIANGAYLDDTSVALRWDKGGNEDHLLAASHGDAEIPINEKLTGDGSKGLSIVLTNDTGTSRVLGGRWEAKDK